MGSIYKTGGVYKRGASNINLPAWGGGGGRLLDKRRLFERGRHHLQLIKILCTVSETSNHTFLHSILYFFDCSFFLLVEGGGRGCSDVQ